MPVFESVFNRIADLQGCNVTKKKTPTQVFSCDICEIVKNIYFEEHLQTITSNICRNNS